MWPYSLTLVERRKGIRKLGRRKTKLLVSLVSGISDLASVKFQGLPMEKVKVQQFQILR